MEMLGFPDDRLHIGAANDLRLISCHMLSSTVVDKLGSFQPGDYTILMWNVGVPQQPIPSLCGNDLRWRVPLTTQFESFKLSGVKQAKDLTMDHLRILRSDMLRKSFFKEKTRNASGDRPPEILTSKAFHRTF